MNVRFNLIYFHDEIIPLSGEFIFNYFDMWSVNNIGSPSSGGIPKLIAFSFFLPFIVNIPIAEIFVITILTYVALLYFKKLLEMWVGQSSFESILGSLLYILLIPLLSFMYGEHPIL